MFAAIVGQAWATGAHPFSLEINGIDIITSVDTSTIDVEMPGPGSNGSMTFTILDPVAGVSVNEWSEVRFIEHAASPYPVTFGGFVQSVRFVVWATAGRSIEVTCVGYGILLDRKVVPAFHVDDTWPVRTADFLVSMVNRYGGLLTALCYNYPAGPLETDTVVSVSNPGNNWGIWNSWYTGFGVDLDAQTLRSFIDALFAASTVTRAVGVAWVDAMRRVCACFDITGALWGDPNGREKLRYLGPVPGIQIDETGTYAVGQVSYEREDTDRTTSAYVAGTGAAGTGWYREASLERAGDLEALVIDSTSTAADDIEAKGRAVVGATTARTARGEVRLSSQSPVDVYPGRNLIVTSPRANLNGEYWRVTSVRIRFSPTGYREYTIGFGGNLAAPSMSRRQGRYVAL